MPANNIPTEQQECEAFHRWLELKKLPHTHIANEGIGRGGADFARTRKMKAMGQSKGFPDYLISIPRKEKCNYMVVGMHTPQKNVYADFRLVAIEMKRQKGGTVGAEQIEWLKVLELSGIETYIAKGFEDAKMFIEDRIDEDDSNCF